MLRDVLVYINRRQLPLCPPSPLYNWKKLEWAFLTHGNGRYGHYKDSVFQSKIEKCKQFSLAAGSGTSEIGPVPKNKRKTDSIIRHNQTLWESGFLWPGTPARYWEVNDPRPCQYLEIRGTNHASAHLGPFGIFPLANSRELRPTVNEGGPVS